MTRLFSVAAILTLGLTFAACSDDKATGSGGATTGKKTAAATKTVEIRGSLYVPETVTIKVGESVKWVNRDTMKHSATRDDADPKFDTKLLTKDQESEPIIFSAASEGAGWQYRCTVKGHEQMKGFVVVTK